MKNEIKGVRDSLTLTNTHSWRGLVSSTPTLFVAEKKRKEKLGRIGTYKIHVWAA
jgi:hypothetical protein